MITSENPHAGQGSVLLDIGGEIGALVVTMPDTLQGVEVEIRPVHHHGGGAQAAPLDHDHDHDHDHAHPAHRPHVAVVARPTARGLVHSLVFPELLRGDYQLYRRPAGPVELQVSITGGAVTEASWPGAT